MKCYVLEILNPRWANEGRAAAGKLDTHLVWWLLWQYMLEIIT